MQLFQHRDLLNCLYALSDNVQAKVVGHGKNGSRNLHAFSVVPHVADERAIDLEGVERKTVELTQRRIARAEVVDSQLDAQGFDVLQHFHGGRGVAHHGAFGNFQL